MISSQLTSIIFYIFTGNFFISNVTSLLCCPVPQKIVYIPATAATCDNIPGAYSQKHGLCAFVTCADVLNHKNKKFCSKGDCDQFGCNCLGGCIEIDEFSFAQASLLKNQDYVVYLEEMFFKKYGHFVGEISRGPNDKKQFLKLGTKIPTKKMNKL